jgi:hypothetical protein
LDLPLIDIFHTNKHYSCVKLKKKQGRISVNDINHAGHFSPQGQNAPLMPSSLTGILSVIGQKIRLRANRQQEIKENGAVDSKLADYSENYLRWRYY